MKIQNSSKNIEEKLKDDDLGQGLKGVGKLNFIAEICKNKVIELNEVS